MQSKQSKRAQKRGSRALVVHASKQREHRRWLSEAPARRLVLLRLMQEFGTTSHIIPPPQRERVSYASTARAKHMRLSYDRYRVAVRQWLDQEIRLWECALAESRLPSPPTWLVDDEV